MLTLTLSIGACVFGSPICAAPATTSAAEPGNGGRRISEPYCGLYCIYAALVLADRPVEFQNLLKPDYFVSRQGSSLSTLAQAAQDHGFAAVPVEHLSVRHLRDSPYPAVLHVKSEIGTSRYDHFVLFIGMSGSEAVLFDPGSQTISSQPLSYLSRQWDGSALLLSKESIDIGSFSTFGWLSFGGIAAVVTLGAVVVNTLRYREPCTQSQLVPYQITRCCRNALTIIGVAVTGGIIFNCSSHNGVFVGANAIEVERAHLGDLLPNFSKAQVQQVLGDPAYAIVDARLPNDYAIGHIPNAINIYPGMPPEQRRAVLHRLARTTTVVVYCQNRGCPYSSSVAADLLNEGFQNIHIYREGWIEWNQ